MALPKFEYKKGDLVLCISTYSECSFIKGHVYKVSRIIYHSGLTDDNSWRSIGVTRDSKGSKSNGWGEQFFIPFTPAAIALYYDNPLQKKFVFECTKPRSKSEKSKARKRSS